MWPWGHLAFGYLLYTVVTKLRGEAAPGGRETLVLAVATQVPDIVDKPLALTFGVLPSGRSLAHSLFVAVSVLALIAVYANHRNDEAFGIAIAIGYLSHLASDAIKPALTRDFSHLAFLIWPAAEMPPPAHQYGIVELFLSMRLTSYALFQFLFAAVAVVVWVRDGSPGVRTLRVLIASTDV